MERLADDHRDCTLAVAYDCLRKINFVRGGKVETVAQWVARRTRNGFEPHQRPLLFP